MANPLFAGLMPGYTGSLIKNGAGILTLAHANTFQGNTSLNQGTLAFSDSNALQYSTLICNGGALATSGNAAQTLNLGGITGGANLPMPSVSLNIGSNNSSGVYSGNLTGPSTGSFTKSGTGKLVLSGNNNYSGNTYVNGGVLGAASLANLGSGQLVFGGGSMQFEGSFDPSARMVLNADTTLDTNGNNMTFAAGFGNGANASLTKAGTGCSRCEEATRTSATRTSTAG